MVNPIAPCLNCCCASTFTSPTRESDETVTTAARPLGRITPRLVERQNHMKTCRKKPYQCTVFYENHSLKTSWNRWCGWCCRNCTSWGRCDENQIPMFTFSFLLSKRHPKGGDLSRHPKGGDFNLKPSTVPHQQSCAKPLTERDSAIGSPSAFWPRPSSVGWGGSMHRCRWNLRLFSHKVL